MTKTRKCGKKKHRKLKMLEITLTFPLLKGGKFAPPPENKDKLIRDFR